MSELDEKIARLREQIDAEYRGLPRIERYSDQMRAGARIAGLENRLAGLKAERDAA